ncbi:MAG: heparinase II/III family protein, partial [Verrucomicrobia bacterium]|nr:heparinase II/III family protein [Verrucomicrobiota bacterium]
AAMVVETLGPDSFLRFPSQPPAAGPRELPHAVALRTGWSATDRAAVVSAVRNPMGHLQADAGQVVLGWHGRFWITDPGYQQYRAGEEREYTLGVQAHNVPVINGTIQKPRAAVVDLVETDPSGRQHTRLQLAGCYPGLPKDAVIAREIWFAAQGPATLVVRDTFGGLPAGAEIIHHWLGGHHLAWAFVGGWARLSDGRRAVWIGHAGAPIAPASLVRHPGSRGPIALAHPTRLSGAGGTSWWVFWCDDRGGWTPPQLRLQGTSLEVASGNSAAAPVRFE